MKYDPEMLFYRMQSVLVDAGGGPRIPRIVQGPMNVGLGLSAIPGNPTSLHDIWKCIPERHELHDLNSKRGLLIESYWT